MASDYGASRLVVLMVTLFVIGARRLEHLAYVATDPLIRRICELARILSAATVRNWLRQFTAATVEALPTLNTYLVLEQLQRLALSRITLDVDGTVVRTEMQVAWAFRGFNPHHRKNPSYYPLLAHIAQTGQILGLRNRPGNVHDSRGAVDFLREALGTLHQRLASSPVVPAGG